MGRWINPSLIAANSHAFMCNCDEGYGYNWDDRYGDSSLGIDNVEYEGHVSTFYRGQRDCSSSVIDCWQEALRGTAYEGCLDGASYTGNIEPVFVGSGLFEVQPMSFIADTGDLYLNIANHVSMCQSQVPDLLSEFSIGETGDVYGNQPGDQTGYEAYIHGYYDYPWNEIIHYIGGELEYTDLEGTNSTPTYNEPVQQQVVNDDFYFTFQTYANGQWLGECTGNQDGIFNSDNDGYSGWDEWTAIRGLAVKCSAGTIRYSAYTQETGWLEEVSQYDINDFENGFAGDLEHDITAIKIYWDSPTGNKVAYYQSYIDGNWVGWQRDDETTNGQYGYSGSWDKDKPITMFRLKVENY